MSEPATVWVKSSKLREIYQRTGNHGDRCALCHIPSQSLAARRITRRLEMAHLVSRARGNRRANVTENVLFLCSHCHGAQHISDLTYDGQRWPNVTIGHLCYCKQELGEWAPEVLARLSGYTPEYWEDQIDPDLPPLIRSERVLWG